MERDLILSKAQRLTRLSHLLYHHPGGLTTRELARLCGVDQRTIQRDLQDFDELGIPLWESEDAQRRYGILKGYYVPPIHLSLPEAASLYLAGRLLARNCDHYDAHAASALAKLANVLPDPMAQHMHASIQRLATREDHRNAEQVLETLVTAWATQRVVQLRYLGASANEERDCELWPYCIEASGLGGAVYVIGYAPHANDLRTFKLDRILAAELTKAIFEPPPDFDGPCLLDSCWGMMYGDELEEVTLHFAASATRRLQETVWHPSQELALLPDGGCELRLTIAHPEEMVYWIRGWGPQVEVVAPRWLREQMAEEARLLRVVYEEAVGGGLK